jgi:hypothetical protein
VRRWVLKGRQECGNKCVREDIGVENGEGVLKERTGSLE